MKIALLISGSPRTFILKEQIEFFNTLLSNLKKEGTVDTFILLKLLDNANSSENLIKSKAGIENLDELISILNPKYIEFFNNFETQYLSHVHDCFFSQITMIDILIRKACDFDTYDMYIRIRPDCIVTQNINLSLLDSDIVYTMKKCDSLGHDCMFIFNKNVLDKWWIQQIRPMPSIYEQHKYLTLDSPDYMIFNSFPTKQLFDGGLIRDYKKIVSWIDSPGHNLEVPIWKYYKNYLELKNTFDEKFIENLSLKYTFKSIMYF